MLDCMPLAMDVLDANFIKFSYSVRKKDAREDLLVL